MNKSQFEDVLITISKFVEDEKLILVAGSQALHGVLEDALLPNPVILSQEVDTSHFPVDELSEEGRSFIDQINEADFCLGEGGAYAEIRGYFMEFVPFGNIVLPEGWEKYTTTYEIKHPDKGYLEITCLGPDEVAVSKLMRLSDKDKEVVDHLIEHDIIDPAVVLGLLEGDLVHSDDMASFIPEALKRATKFIKSYL